MRWVMCCVLLAGYVTAADAQDTKKKAMFSYLNCLKSNAFRLDDLSSDALSVGFAAVAACRTLMEPVLDALDPSLWGNDRRRLMLRLERDMVGTATEFVLERRKN